MFKFEGECKDILDKTEWVAVATQGAEGPHLVATWGDYVRALGVQDGGTILIPAGRYRRTEENLQRSDRVEVMIAWRQAPRARGVGQGYLLSGRAALEFTGEYAEAAKSKFPWARGALVIRLEKAEPLL